MRELGKYLAVAAAVGVVGLTINDALAGGVGSVIPPGQGFGPVASWFSVAMNAGQVLGYNAGPPNAPRMMLIDDVTYSVDMNPYLGGVNGPGFGGRAAAFNFNDLMGVEELFGNALPSPFPLITPNPFLFFSWGNLTINGLINWDVNTWAGAKGDFFALELNNQFLPQFGGGNFFFDRISHTANAQFIGREEWFNDEARGTALGVGVSISQAIVNTSESRHYQTPHICLPGSTVVSATPAGASAYNNVRIYIKGRIVNMPLPMPIVNSDVTVTP